MAPPAGAEVLAAPAQPAEGESPQAGRQALPTHDDRRPPPVTPPTGDVSPQEPGETGRVDDALAEPEPEATDPAAALASDDGDERWAGMNDIAWEEPGAEPDGEQAASPQAARKPRKPAQHAEVAEAPPRLTLAQALERIAPSTRKILQENLRGEIRELRRYTPGPAARK